MALLAGCAGDPGEAPDVAPTGPGAETGAANVNETKAVGRFWLAADVTSGGQSYYLTDGVERFDVPPEAAWLRVRLEWSSPLGSQFTLRLGAEDGSFAGEPVTGASPLTVEVNDEVPSGEVMLLVDPAEDTAVIPYQEFRWEATFAHPAKQAP